MSHISARFLNQKCLMSCLKFYFVEVIKLNCRKKSAYYFSWKSLSSNKLFIKNSNFTFIKQTIFRNDFCAWTMSKDINYDIVKPGHVSPPLLVPDNISKPDYALSGYEVSPQIIDIKSNQDIECIKASCRLAKRVLDHASSLAEVGRTTDEIDRIVHETCLKLNIYPSPLNYRGFPKSVCTSVNNVACHGIPDDRPLSEGDIITIDVSIYHNGFHGDCATTLSIGNVDPKAANLIKVAEKSLKEAIYVCYPGQNFSEIGSIISKIAAEESFTVIPSFCGHGIGRYFHGPPDIYHCENEEEGIMEEGMVFTIEPVISEGGPDIVILEDGWTAVSLDNSRSAQFEHTVLITKNGAQVLTSSS